MKFFDRFCHKYNRFGIHNLMFIILGGNVAVFTAILLTGSANVATAFYFHPALIAGGQYWRIVTFLFVPPMMPDSFLNIIFFGFFVYLYYIMGRTLEQVFGCLKFTIYYFSGAILTLAVSWWLGMLASAAYLNLAIFMAFATLNPDFTLRIMLILPVKIKYLAYLSAAYQVYIIIANPFPYRLLPVIALANYLFFFWPYFSDFTKRSRYRVKAIPFRQTVSKARRDRGYVHRCTVCGLTDADAPGQEFRYCSLCTGYKCYCERHLFDHEHT